MTRLIRDTGDEGDQRVIGGHMVVDGHADILARMCEQRLPFVGETPLHQGYENLRRSGVDVQVCAMFASPRLTAADQLAALIDMYIAFTRQILATGDIAPLAWAQDVPDATRQGASARSMHALLSVEGAGALDGRMNVLYTLFDLGVRMVGLTWNDANCLADGVGETRGAGLTAFGVQVVREMQQLGMVVDVSHLAPRGVHDVISISAGPVVASHSNAAAVHGHRRNLGDEQMRAIAETGGVIGMTFVPGFISSSDVVSTDDLLRHVDHALRVVGPDAVALGSDFDGIETTLGDLRHGLDYPAFLNRLHSWLGDVDFGKVAGGNWLRVLRRVLPAR
jgi:membrane dipeptidase